MSLRLKFIGAFFAVAVVTLIAAIIGYLQTDRLASALYEIGVVRMPSIQALDIIYEAKTALDASKRELMREAAPEDALAARSIPRPIPAEAGDRAGDAALEGSTVVTPHPWAAVLAEEVRRQEQAWDRAQKGWRIYDALPKTADEAAQWKDFTTVWTDWRASYEQVMALLLEAQRTGDATALARARAENNDRLFDLARDSRQRLRALLDHNDRMVSESRQQSVASYRDTHAMRLVMLLAGVFSVATVIGCGFLLIRQVFRPIDRMADVFTRISAGALELRAPVTSRDEVGRMAAAMNSMVDSLRTSKLRFRAVFENSIDAIGLSSANRMVIVNPALRTLFRYDPEDDLTGRSIFDFVVPEHHERIRDRLTRRERGEALPPMFELTGLRKDGTSFDMEVQSAAFQLRGEPHVVAIHRDITERKRAATQLADAAGRLELAMRASKLGLWRRHLVTGEGQWSLRTFEILGLPPTASAPDRDRLLSVIEPEDRDETLRGWQRLPAPGQSLQRRFRVRWPDGQVRHIEEQWVVQIEPGGRSEWAIGVVGDITDIVGAAEESARLREQLVQAQKMETLGTLSAGIAHDFNNLLTGISGFIELAALSLPPAHESAELLRHARQGAVSARELVRRILNFSRQSHPTKRTSVNLGEVVREMVPLISAALPPTVKVAVDLEPTLPAVLADTGQIQQILMNLCTNAAHAMAASGGTVRLSAHSHRLSDSSTTLLPAGCGPGLHVCLAVSDSGCGMDAATLQRIFEPFFTTKKPGEGTGLGLAIVRDIMATHEGGLTVTSAPGRGTTFSLYFPASMVGAASLSSRPSQNSPRGRGQKILVIDDEPSIARVLEISLEKDGYAPEICTQPLEAWDRFERAPADFELVVTDAQMPGIGGFEFATRARSLRPRLPVIVMSGRFEKTDVVADPTLAGIRQVMKPFQIADMLDEVSVALQTTERGR